MKITCEMVEQRLSELRDEQFRKLSEASVLLGCIQECELLLIVLKKEEPEGNSPPPKILESER